MIDESQRPKAWIIASSGFCNYENGCKFRGFTEGFEDNRQIESLTKSCVIDVFACCATFWCILKVIEKANGQVKISSMSTQCY